MYSVCNSNNINTKKKKKILAEWKKWFHLFLWKRLFKIVDLNFWYPKGDSGIKWNLFLLTLNGYQTSVLQKY